MAETGAAFAVDPSAPGARLREVRLPVAWDVRGDDRRPAFAAAAQDLFGMALPARPASSAAQGDRALLRLGPRSWLLVAEAVPCEFERARDALNAAGGALFDLSASYVAWHVGGRAAARVLNRGCLLDLHPRAFARGACTQTLFGHVNAIVCRTHAAPAFLVLVARSLAEHAGHELREAGESERTETGTPLALREALGSG